MAVNLTENKALARRYYDEVLTARNRGVLGQLLDSSFVSHLSDGSGAGAEAYAAAVDATFAAFPGLAVTVHDQVAEDDKVVTRWSAAGTHHGDFAGVPASGRVITVTGIHIHRVRDGRLAGHWEELNMLGVLRQLGVLSWPRPGLRAPGQANPCYDLPEMSPGPRQRSGCMTPAGAAGRAVRRRSLAAKS